MRAMKYILCGALLAGCSLLATMPEEPPATPDPCPTPTPEPEPVPGQFEAPQFAMKNTPFSVTLCAPFEFRTELYADAYKLGTFGLDEKSGCMLLVVPGLNGTGKRTLKARGFERQITVFDGRTLTTR